MLNAIRRSCRTSVGTWYVAPPTRRDLTSIIGVALRTACSKISMPGLWAWFSTSSKAEKTILCAVVCLPLSITFFMKRVRSVLPYFGSGGILRRTARRRLDILYPRLLPYFERPRLRSSTPAVSRVPRMTWYRTPGKSLTLPPLMRTTECSCRL